ncbi:hypothetical protein B2J88_22970 [Rhodococcus sp. SRB_17]|nr:hypothetical protein [Rhodococcus sp. SRB_17]
MGELKVLEHGIGQSDARLPSFLFKRDCYPGLQFRFSRYGSDSISWPDFRTAQIIPALRTFLVRAVLVM